MKLFIKEGIQLIQAKSVSEVVNKLNNHEVLKVDNDYDNDVMVMVMKLMTFEAN